jgi:hypothetical protein
MMLILFFTFEIFIRRPGQYDRVIQSTGIPLVFNPGTLGIQFECPGPGEQNGVFPC